MILKLRVLFGLNDVKLNTGNKTSRETEVKVDGPCRRRPKEDENYWLEGEGRGQTGVE